MSSSKFINKEIQMYSLVNVDHNGMAAHLTRSDSEGFLRSAEYPMPQMGPTMCYGMTVNRTGKLGVCATKMKALTVKKKTVTDW
jgi:hypothetical protein